MFKIITVKKVHIITLQSAICTKSMELFELYLKEKTNFFDSVKLLFIKVECLTNCNNNRNG